MKTGLLRLCCVLTLLLGCGERAGQAIVSADDAGLPLDSLGGSPGALGGGGSGGAGGDRAGAGGDERAGDGGGSGAGGASSLGRGGALDAGTPRDAGSSGGQDGGGAVAILPNEGGAEPEAGSDAAVRGLCASCSRNSDCTADGAYCLWNTSTGERFCGRACDRSCPDGYRCQTLGNSVRQCVPITGNCDQVAVQTTPDLTALRAYALARINALRSRAGLTPFTEDACLDDLAQASCVEMARTGERFSKFDRECEPILPGCECGWNNESEATTEAFGLTTDQALSDPVDSDTTLRSDLLSTRSSRIGIGIIISGDKAWISLTYAP